jgi:N-acetyl-alpha-D-glucosaminyl L-malate synthase BshA
MHISNFRPVKRVGMVLDVFTRIRESVRARLVMIGDGPDRGALEQRVIDEGLTGSVTFLGEQLDLVPWLSAADLFLLPSAQESFGLAALEAMACQVPVVASRVGGLPDVIEDGVAGFICDPDDVGAMAARGAAILRDAALRERMGRAAAASVSRRFCVDVIVPHYEQYYREILAAPARPAR